MNVSCLTEFQCALYAEGELAPREAREAERHLEHCDACQKLLGALREENRVLVECFQRVDDIEYELEDEALSAPQARRLSAVRLIAFVLAMSVLLRPVLDALEQVGALETLSWLPATLAYAIPAVISFVQAVLNNASWIALSAVLLLALFLFSRRAMLTSSILSVIALLSVFSSSSYGLDIRRSDKPVTVPADEVVNDTLVIAAETAVIEGTVNGDLVAFARQVTIRGRVKGNVVSFAGRVQVEGTVEGSVFGFAQSIQTRGQVAHNIYAVAQTSEILRDARIEENAVVFAAQADIEGTIGKDAQTYSNRLNVLAPAKIGGNLAGRVARAGNSNIATGATIGGKTDVRAPEPQPSRYSRLSFYIWQTIWFAAALVTGLLLFWAMPMLSRTTFETTRQMLEAAGIGFIALIAAPIASLVVAITLIGLPLGVMAFAAWLVAIYLAKILVAQFLGRSLLSNTGDPHSPIVLALVTGLALVFIATNLPLVGGLINFLLVILGVGMLVTRMYQIGGWRAQAA